MKHQRGIEGADLASITAKRNQTAQARTAQRTAAIQKAKSEKKDKEAKKTKVSFRCFPRPIVYIKFGREDLPTPDYGSTKNFKAAGEGWKGRPLMGGFWHARFFFCSIDCMFTHHTNTFTCTREAGSHEH